jgi:hypothetical protein
MMEESSSAQQVGVAGEAEPVAPSEQPLVPPEGSVAPPPDPMPRFTHDPVKVTVGRIQTLVFTIIFGHLGMFAVVALYYLLFEVYHPFTLAWHHVVADSYWRHLIRNVGEYFLGTLLAMLILWNPFRWQRRMYRRKLRWSGRPHLYWEERAPSRLDRFELRLRIPNLHQKEHSTAWQFVLALPVAIIYAIPGFLLGAGLVWVLHKGLHAGRLYPILSAHPSFVARLYTEQTDQHVVGILAGLIMGRRPMRKVFQDIQHFFAERRVARGSYGRWWDPLAYRVLVEYIADTQGQDAALRGQAARGLWVRSVLVGGSLLLFGLAGFGVYVLRDIAPK